MAHETHADDFRFKEMTIDQLQALMASGDLSSETLVRAYLDRIEAIDRNGPTLRSVIETNPEAEQIAAGLDAERRSGRTRGPLHGIPILVKDNIETADRMTTTAGSLALEGSIARQDAGIVARLREAGAVILGKTNLSEWANFRSPHSSSGWSARGGQCRNPYSLDRTPLGSSAGSGVATSANLAAAALGTETDGSILTPSAASALVGVKPTVGLTSRAGVIPISHSQDTVGPMGRSVADGAAVLSAIAGSDPRDPATQDADARRQADYTRFLDAGALRGARIGVPRNVFFGYNEKTDTVIEEAIRALADAGAVIVDPADIPTARELTFLGPELTVLLYEFKHGINAYLSQLPESVRVRSLRDLIEFNESHREQELKYFGQEFFHMAEAKGDLQDAEYREALERSRRTARQEGIDAVMDQHQLDALVMPTTSQPWKIDLVNGDHIQGLGSSPAAQAGYPAITVPGGYTHGLPVGLLFTGRAYSEPRLIALAYAYEQAAKPRVAPAFRESTP